MAIVPQYLVEAEGFDIYPVGAISTTNYPWTVTNSAYTGTVTGSAGAFGGNGLVFASQATNATGLNVNFPSTMSILRSGGNSAVLCWSGWVTFGSPSSQVQDALIALASSTGSTSNGYNLFGVSNSSATGLLLCFPSNLNNLFSSPYTFSIEPSTYYWVSICFAFTAGAVTATYQVNGVSIQSNVSLSWTADGFSSGMIANQIRFGCSRMFAWTLDDMVIQGVSSSDASWPGGTVQPSLVPQPQPRKIQNAVAVSNGPIIQWSVSGSEPNWQSATDPTGANSVIATDVNQTDLYNWTATGATGIMGIVLKGTTTRYANVTPQRYIASTQSAFPLVTYGPQRVIGISENDGTNGWTAASIAAASFGQESH